MSAPARRMPAPEEDASQQGTPMSFQTGQFTGQTIRAELHELQKAEHGRKCAVKDRRPVDPPPVAELRLYRVFNEGSVEEYETELGDYDDVHCEGLLCHVDLFTAPLRDLCQVYAPEFPPTGACDQQSYIEQPDQDHSAPSQLCLPAQVANSEPLPPIPHPGRLNFGELWSSGLPASMHLPEPLGSHMPLAPASEPTVPKRTGELAGATFVQASKLSYDGKTRIMFAFPDLAVKTEGDFLLRYECFDVLSGVMGLGARPIWAQCYGGAFHIWPTKAFPGLLPSTRLTQCLAAAGVAVNHRKPDRAKTAARWSQSHVLHQPAGVTKSHGKEAAKSKAVPVD